jgi:uroporphyrinogen decarboxylase
MPELTSHERIHRMYEHREADRVPIWDSPWDSTLQRWRREGLPADVDFETTMELLGFDRYRSMRADNSPRYPTRVIEETEEYVTEFSAWGVTSRSWKHAGGVPEFLDFTITTPDAWRAAKARMTPDRDRINWAALARDYPRWRREGAWIRAQCWFGFDATHSFVTGTERVLIAMATDPEWMVDMFNAQLDLHIALFDMAWEAGYRFDEIRWCDDMGYKLHQFFSPAMYRDLLKPVHRRAVEWAHSRGARAYLHSCGDIRPFVPDLVEIGVDMLNPLEVKAGMDPATLKKQYGDRLAFHGGLNAVLFDRPDELWSEMRRVIPAMKTGGGDGIGSDHSIPQTVSLETFREFIRLARELGSYE